MVFNHFLSISLFVVSKVCSAMSLFLRKTVQALFFFKVLCSEMYHVYGCVTSLLIAQSQGFVTSKAPIQFTQVDNLLVTSRLLNKGLTPENSIMSYFAAE